MTTATTDDSFVVRYDGQYPDYYITRSLPVFLLFAVFALSYLYDELRQLIFSRHNGNYKFFFWGEFILILVCLAAPLLDLALTLRRVQRDAIALIISTDGIMGSVLHVDRLFRWSEIVGVDFDGDVLTVRRHPRGPLEKLIPRRGTGDIHVPVHQIDQDAYAILAAVRHFSPTGHQCRAPA